MSIAEKLITVAENQQRVYNKGYTDGYAKGEVESGGFLWQNVVNYDHLFFGVEFPTNTEIALDISNHYLLKESTESKRIPVINYAFANITGLTSVKIILNNSYPISMIGAFGSKNIQKVDLSEAPLIANASYAFQYSNIEEVIGELDFTFSTSVKSMFEWCTSLTSVRFKKETLALSISLNKSNRLTNESIQSIIDGLADLTDKTTQTITFGSTVGAKLTDTQKATITAKNWTLAY